MKKYRNHTKSSLGVLWDLSTKDKKLTFFLNPLTPNRKPRHRKIDFKKENLEAMTKPCENSPDNQIFNCAWCSTGSITSPIFSTY